MKIIDFESIPSTNDYCKEHASEGDMIVTAKCQTAGRGSKNRSFVSEKGGLYLTKMQNYTSFPASEVFKIMLDTSIAVCKTVERFGLKPAVKWPNDVFVGGKKICGILIENTFSGNSISRSVVGIGLNINNALPNELASIATTMAKEGGTSFNVDEVKDELVKNLRRSFSVEEYKSYLFFLGQEVCLVQGEEKRAVTARDVDDFGRLIVEEKNGGLYVVTAGEVSLRFM